MNAELLFSIANLAAVPGWLLLLFAPRWGYSAPLVSGVILPGLLAAFYAVLIFGSLGSGEGGFGSIAEVRLLFADDMALLAGWVHYLAFDLFIGSWEVRDAQRHGIAHLAVVPCLLLTFLFGPVGLLAYLLIRGGWQRRVAIASGDA